MQVRVLIVDDHRLVRAGLIRMLSKMTGIEVVGEADSGESALVTLKKCRPNVVLMDLRMPGMGGLEAIRRSARLNSCCPVVSRFPKTAFNTGATLGDTTV